MARQVYHFECPRAFTATVRCLDLPTLRALHAAGCDVAVVDLNPGFWRFLLASDHIGVAAFSRPDLTGRRVADLRRAMAQLDEKALPFGLSGLSLTPDEEDSSAQLVARLHKPAIASLLDRYLGRVFDRHSAALDAPVISLGCESHRSLGLLLATAGWLKREARYRGHVTIGRHASENFSLSFFKEFLQEGVLFDYVDSIVDAHELLGVTLAALAAGKSTGVGNLIVREGPKPVALPPKTGLEASGWERWRDAFYTRYAEHLDAPMEGVMWQTSATGNRCYWSKCTFCVQINKHTSPRFYDDAPRIAQTAEEIAAVRHLGCDHVLLDDEALSPRSMKGLVAALSQLRAPVSWNARIIADPGLSIDLMRRLREAGCRELLIGLETLDQDTATAMGKVSEDAEVGAVEKLCGNLTLAGISQFLNFIYGFPSERCDALPRAMSFARGVRRHAPDTFLKFNRFALFRGSRIFQDPLRYGIVAVQARSPGQDLKLAYHFRDKAGRRSWDAPARRIRRVELGLGPAQQSLARLRHGRGFVDTLAHLDYSSAGFFERVRTRRSLLQVFA